MKRTLLMLLLFGLLLLVSSCDVEVEGDEAGECSDGVDNDQDGTLDCGDDGCAIATACAGDDDDDTADDDDTTGDPCAGIEPGPGSLWGTLGRATPMHEDGIGTLYFSVFDDDPLQNDEACEVAAEVVPNLDLSDEPNGFSYTVSGIPTSAAAYYVRALFDDNGDFDASVGPSYGDLLNRAEGETFPTVTVSGEEPVELDLNLILFVGGAPGDDDDDSGDDDDSAGK